MIRNNYGDPCGLEKGENHEKFASRSNMKLDQPEKEVEEEQVLFLILSIHYTFHGGSVYDGNGQLQMEH